MFTRVTAGFLICALLSGCGKDTTGPGQEITSEDGLLLVGTNLNDIDRIYTMKPDGSEIIMVSGNMTRARSAVWSPDRTKIAYVDSWRAIYVMNVDGTDRRRIYDSSEWSIGRLDWSRDGRYIAFDGTIPFYSGTVLAIISVEGGEVRELLRGWPRFALEPSWSPDGRRIAFTAVVEGQGRQLHVMKADGTEIKQITSDPGFWGGPRWSPRANTIAYVSNRDGSIDIWRVESDGTNARRLTDATGASTAGPAWSPDGKRIAFHWSPNEGGAQIATASVDGSDVRYLDSPEFVSYVAW